MDIRYFDPLARAYRRMTKALFRPFDIRKWFAMGFTAFLAGLMDCHGGNGGGGGRHWSRGDWDDIIYFPRHAQQWLVDHPQWVLLIVLVLALVLILIVVFTWVSSRGKFMFLDNVVHDRAQVTKPWYEFRNEAGSLFLWRFTVGLLVLAITAPYLVYCYSILVGVYESEWDVAALILPGIFMFLGLIAIFVLAKFLNLLVIDFVVPIMYKSRRTVLAAWGTFLPLFGKHLLSFIGYGMFIALLEILIVVGIIAFILFTCCIGLIFIIIPYIGSVVLLPVSFTLRALSVEFLEQFGPEYQIFPGPEPASDSTGLPAS
jgi:hypothetical protein